MHEKSENVLREKKEVEEEEGKKNQKITDSPITQRIVLKVWSVDPWRPPRPF